MDFCIIQDFKTIIFSDMGDCENTSVWTIESGTKAMVKLTDVLTKVRAIGL